MYIFPQTIRGQFRYVADEYENLEEIRLRAGKPIIIRLHKGEFFLDGDGRFSIVETGSMRMEMTDITDILNQICHNSIYAYEDELKMGFITVAGGHRVGVAGQVVLDENGNLRTLKHISYLNIRIAHQIKGVANQIMPYLFEDGEFLNTLIISPPGCGKTTLLRDIIRQVSDGSQYCTGKTVGVIDERSEIAGSFMGIPQNDVGIRTDILDACPKVHGMMMLLRSMAPKVIALDELGGIEDVQALKMVSACGCGLLATVHGVDIKSLHEKSYMEELISEGIFLRYIVLSKQDGCPVLKGIYQKEFHACYGSSVQSVSL